MKTLYTSIKLPALKGKKTIARSDMFTYIDPDFKNYGTDKIGKATKETVFAVMEMEKDGTDEMKVVIKDYKVIPCTISFIIPNLKKK